MKSLKVAVVALALSMLLVPSAFASRFHVKHHMRMGMHHMRVKMHHGHMHMHNMIHHGHM